MWFHYVGVNELEPGHCTLFLIPQGWGWKSPRRAHFCKVSVILANLRHLPLDAGIYLRHVPPPPSQQGFQLV